MGGCGVPTEEDKRIIEIIEEISGLKELTLHKGGQPHRSRSRSRGRSRARPPSPSRSPSRSQAPPEEEEEEYGPPPHNVGEEAAEAAPAVRVEPVNGATKLHHAVTVIISAALAGASYVAIKKLVWQKLIASGIIPQPCEDNLDLLVDLFKGPLSIIGYKGCAERQAILNQNILAIAAAIGLTGGVSRTLQRVTNAGKNTYNTILNWVHDNMGKCSRKRGGSRRVAKGRRSRTAKRRQRRS